MNLSKEDVIKEFCKLSSHVNDKVFDYIEPSDCFCCESENQDDIKQQLGSFYGGFQFSSKVIDFIKRAVEDSLKLIE